MREADARRSASVMNSNSIKLRFGGAQVGCTINTSPPRTFSFNSTDISPSEKVRTTASPSRMPRRCAMRCASSGLALPEKTMKLDIYDALVFKVCFCSGTK